MLYGIADGTQAAPPREAQGAMAVSATPATGHLDQRHAGTACGVPLHPCCMVKQYKILGERGVQVVYRVMVGVGVLLVACVALALVALVMTYNR